MRNRSRNWWMIHPTVICSGHFLAQTISWELSSWLSTPPESSLMLVKPSSCVALHPIQPYLAKPDMWASELVLINLAETPFNSLPGVPSGQVPGLESGLSRSVMRAKSLIMHSGVLPIPGSRSLLPCGVQRLLMMKAGIWLLLPIILSISLLS